MLCEKCNKLIPENLGYCPTCKTKEEDCNSLPIELKRNGPMMVPEEPTISNSEPEMINNNLPTNSNDVTNEAVAQSNRGFGLLLVILVIGFGAFIVLQNNWFGDDYPGEGPIYNNGEPSGQTTNPTTTSPPEEPNGNIPITPPAGHSLYRHIIAEDFNPEWYESIEPGQRVNLYFISEQMHGVLIENVTVAIVRNASGADLSAFTGTPAILDIILPNEYQLLIDMMMIIDPEPSIIVVPEGREANISGTSVSTEQIKAFIRTGR